MTNKLSYLASQIRITQDFKTKLGHNFHELTYAERLLYFLFIRPSWNKERRFFFEGHLGLAGQMYSAERRALYEAIKDRKPRQCFEIGTYTGGGSTFFAASALAEANCGRMITMETDPYYRNRAARYYEQHLPRLAAVTDFVLGNEPENLLSYIDPQNGIDCLLLDGAEDSQQTLDQYRFFSTFFRTGTLLILHDWNTAKTEAVKPVILADEKWQLIKELRPPESVGMAIFTRS